MSLTSCIKKAGGALSPSDKSTILARARELRSDGMAANDAAIAAVDELLAHVQELVRGARQTSPIAKAVEQAQDQKPTEQPLADDITPAPESREPQTPPDERLSRQDTQVEANTTDTIRAALVKRFGNQIARLEKRNFLKIWPSTQAFNDGQNSRLEGPAQGYWDGKTAHLFADGIAPGNEVAVLLHEVGEHASMEAMLGPRHYGRLVERAYDLLEKGDDSAVRAMDRIPDDTPAVHKDSEFLAYMIETVAADGAQATPGARKWLADIVAAIRAWFATTGLNKTLERYGQGIELTPADIAALAARAVAWQAEQGKTSADDGAAFSRAGQTDTPEFKAWFGKSTVVDAQGKPLVVYHGTSADFGAFAYGDPVHFSADPETASRYAYIYRPTGGQGARVLPVYLSLKNPKYSDGIPNSDAIAQAKREGHDGFVLGYDGHYVAFRPEQIKSATGNSGNFDSTNPDIRFSRPPISSASQQVAKVFGPANATGKAAGASPPSGNAGNPQGASAAAASAPWSVTDPDRLDNLIRRMQDNRIDIKRTVDAIKATGTNIADDADAYLMDELYIGKVRAGIDRLADEQVTPLLRAIGNSGFTLDQVNEYLWARHAEEYNRQMAKVNDVPFTPTLDLAGMSTVDANAKLAAFAAGPNFTRMQALAKMVDAITNDVRTRIVTDGLGDPAMIQAWEGAYKYYVPLQRDVEESGGKAAGYNVRGSESQRAMGSTKEAVNILANVIAQAEAVIIRSEKAVVGRSVLNLARQQPNPDFWSVDTPPTERAIDPSTGLVTTRVKPNYMALDNVFVVKEAGVEHFVVFNDKNPRAVQFARTLKNLDVANLGPVMETINKGTRYLAKWVTARNPLFWMTNFARDVQSVAFNLQSTPLKGQAPAVMSKIPQALAGMASNKLGKKAGKWAKLEEEFKDAGGQTGYLDNYRDSVERMGEIVKEIDRMQQSKGDPRRIARGLLEIIDGTNDVIENGVRLAVYAQAREEGLSEARAASIAKNISVNFNRKGNDTATYNALYMFFNANVQGTARMLVGIKDSRRAQVYAGAMTVIGASMALLNWTLGGDDDESRKKRYQLVPEWERERNWIVFVPGTDTYFKIPLPLGLHVLFNAGRVLAELGLEGAESDPLDKAASFVASAFGAFNPVGGGLPSADAKGVAQAATPTVLRPVVDVVANQNFAGTPIARETRGYGYQKPAYTRARPNTPSYWTTAAKAMNDWTGGDNVKAGKINLKPEQLAYLLKGYVMPGIAQTADKVAGQAVGRKETPLDQIVGASKFFGRIDENERERAAYDAARKDTQRMGEYKQYISAGERDKARQVLKDWGGGDERQGRKLLAQARSFDRVMAGLRKQKSSAAKVADETTRNERMDRLDERISRAQAVYLSNTRELRSEGVDE